MQIKEIKIAGFQSEQCRLQLVYVVTRYQNGYINAEYQVRKNRKIKCTSMHDDKAKRVFSDLMNEELFKPKFEDE